MHQRKATGITLHRGFLVAGDCLAAAVLVVMMAGCGEGGTPSPPAPPPPACRMSAVDLDPVKKTELKGKCEDSDYAAVCDDAITELDNSCAKQCALFKKRAAAPLTGATCGANPTTTKFKPLVLKDNCVAEQEPKTGFNVTCTVSATCTCDP